MATSDESVQPSLAIPDGGAAATTQPVAKPASGDATTTQPTAKPASGDATTTQPTPTSDGAVSQEREVLAWSLFGDACRELARQVLGDGWLPEVVVAVARGGLLPAGAVAYALGVKAVGTMNVEFYTGIGAHLSEPVFLPPLMDTSALVGKRVLIVDDVADSGKTLEKVRDAVAHMAGTQAAGIRTAVLYVKPRSVVTPDYVWRRTEKWITFPWSALPAGLPGGGVG